MKLTKKRLVGHGAKAIRRRECICQCGAVFKNPKAFRDHLRAKDRARWEEIDAIS